MDELERLRSEYARREADPRYRDWYAPGNPANRFIVEERDREIARLLSRGTGTGLVSARVLDVGCGGGHELVKFIAYGARPCNLFGIDLLPDRVQGARARYAEAHFACGDAGLLPYPSASFDLVLQFTVFTSILDDRLRRRMAAEMQRVLQPRGRILWYDYRQNPTNPRTRGIKQAEIRQLFPNCDFEFRRVTLAPPLLRWLAPRSRRLCGWLNRLPFLKTHYLALIRAKTHETTL